LPNRFDQMAEERQQSDDKQDLDTPAPDDEQQVDPHRAQPVDADLDVIR
jgi:hypothetical protein